MHTSPIVLGSRLPKRIHARTDADLNSALPDFDKDTYTAVRRIAAKWCTEPSVHGVKPRPKNAKLII